MALVAAFGLFRPAHAVALVDAYAQTTYDTQFLDSIGAVWDTAGGATNTAAATAEHALVTQAAGGNTVAGRIVAQLGRLRYAAGDIPALASLSGAAELIPMVGVALGGFSIGYKIGGTIARWFGFGVSDQGTTRSGGTIQDYGWLRVGGSIDTSCTGSSSFSLSGVIGQYVLAYRAHNVGSYTCMIMRQDWESQTDANQFWPGNFSESRNQWLNVRGHGAVETVVTGAAGGCPGGGSCVLLARTQAQIDAGYAPNTEVQKYGSQTFSTSHTLNPASDSSRRSAARTAIATGDYPDARNWINFFLDPTDNPDPTVPVTIPAIDTDELVTHYESRLDTLGLSYTVTTGTVNFGKPSHAVLSTSPTPGTSVELGSSVTLTENPVWFTIPAPDGTETYTAYIARLTALGFVGTATRTDLTGSDVDGRYGPNVAIYVSPAIGTAVLATAGVTVTANPSTATDPATAPVPAPGGCTPWVSPSIDLSPLQGHGWETRFPFGLFGWMADGLSSWAVPSSAPVITIPFFSSDLVVDFGEFDPAMAILRPTIAIVSLLLLVWWLGTALLGIGGGGSDE